MSRPMRRATWLGALAPAALGPYIEKPPHGPSPRSGGLEPP